jgi:hypothetical protein
MSNPYAAAIEDIKKVIASKESEILPLRITLNQLCKLAGLAEEYPDLDARSVGDTALKTATLTWKPDQFVGRPLATCVTEYFEARDAKGMERPATIDEIYEALCQGNYKFEGTTGNVANTKRGIKISLTKNTAQFVKLRDDTFSLKKWYNIRTPRKTNGTKTDEQAIDEGLDEAIANNPESAAAGPKPGDDSILE